MERRHLAKRRYEPAHRSDSRRLARALRGRSGVTDWKEAAAGSGGLIGGLPALRRVLFQPAVYHRVSAQFRTLTRSSNDLPGHFNARRMNGDVPLFALDPSADGISDASVFHSTSLDPNQNRSNASGVGWLGTPYTVRGFAGVC